LTLQRDIIKKPGNIAFQALIVRLHELLSTRRTSEPKVKTVKPAIWVNHGDKSKFNKEEGRRKREEA
jgi:hypothetical protein